MIILSFVLDLSIVTNADASVYLGILNINMALHTIRPLFKRTSSSL